MKSKVLLVCSLVGIVVVLASITLYSLPRLAAEHGTPCVTCHISPNGGGMRNEFGNVSVAYNELCLQQTKKYFDKYKLRPRISDNLTYGVDYRLLYTKDIDFFRMQGDFYLSAELIKNLTFNFTLGQSNLKDSYAMLKLKDEKHYWFKVGRFYPAFGLRDPDHTAYVRTVPGFGPELTLDGLSIGGNFFNGSNMTIEFFQPNKQKIATFHSFRADYLGPFGIISGVSWRQSENMGGVDPYRGFPIAKSLFGGLSYGRLTGLFEVQAVGKGNEQRTFYGQLAGRVIYGLYLLGEYNYHDPDWGYKTGVNQFYRFTVDFFPVPFVEVAPAVTLTKNAGKSAFDDTYLIQFHINY